MVDIDREYELEVTRTPDAINHIHGYPAVTKSDASGKTLWAGFTRERERGVAAARQFGWFLVARDERGLLCAQLICDCTSEERRRLDKDWHGSRKLIGPIDATTSTSEQCQLFIRNSTLP